MRGYPEYKESGVEWIGNIPRHWKIEKIKHIATFVSEKSTPEADAVKISPENVESETGKVLDFYSSYDAVGVKFQYGDVLFNKLRVYLNKVVFAEYDGYSLGEIIVMRPSLQDMGKYLFYLMLSSRFIEYCNAISYGVKMPRTAVDDILNAQIPMTSDKEQAQIANFLDRKTEQIDELIRIKERRIELLQEQRTALINQVVTKGLDPNVEMKPSGVEWIGEIPKNWGMKRLKYIADLNMGQSPPSEGYNSDQFGTPFLQGNAEFGAHHPTPKIYCPTAKKYANQGDILLSVRAPVGAINIANQEYGIGRGLCAIRPRANQLKHRYAKYLLGIVRAELHAVATGSTYDAVTVDEVSNVTCVVPSLSEQAQISDFLDRKTKQIDELIAAEQRKIERLKEYRQSLISEAVTGKIDVRNEV